MNKMKEVTKLLGLEIGEKFNIIYDNGSYSNYNPYYFTETKFLNRNGTNIECLLELITGHYAIEKLPFVPKVGEKYWTYSAGFTLPVIEYYSWGNSCYDKERKLLGIVFRTEQEAIGYIHTWEKRLEGEEL